MTLTKRQSSDIAAPLVLVSDDAARTVGGIEVLTLGKTTFGWRHSGPNAFAICTPVRFFGDWGNPKRLSVSKESQHPHLFDLFLLYLSLGLCEGYAQIAIYPLRRSALESPVA
jgi:hypothetical protein